MTRPRWLWAFSSIALTVFTAVTARTYVYTPVLSSEYEAPPTTPSQGNHEVQWSATDEQKMRERIERFSKNKGRFSDYEARLLSIAAKERGIVLEFMEYEDFCDILHKRTSTFREVCDTYSHLSPTLQMLDPLITRLIEQEYIMPLHIPVPMRPNYERNYERRIEGLNLFLLDAVREITPEVRKEFTDFCGVDVQLALKEMIDKTLAWDFIHPVDESV